MENSSLYTPDAWVVIKNNENLLGKEDYRVVAGWFGGYLQGGAWRINSGISSVKDMKTHYEIHGESGSVYHCFKNAYHPTHASAQVLNYLTSHFDVEIITEEDIEGLMGRFYG